MQIIKTYLDLEKLIDSEFSSISVNDLNWFNTTFKASYTLKDRELKFINTIVNSDRWGSFTENGVVLLQGAP
jgi:hypothetical protein